MKTVLQRIKYFCVKSYLTNFDLLMSSHVGKIGWEGRPDPDRLKFLLPPGIFAVQITLWKIKLYVNQIYTMQLFKLLDHYGILSKSISALYSWLVMSRDKLVRHSFGPYFFS